MASYRFADGSEFDATSGEVRRNGTTIRLEPQPAAVLALLAFRAGDLVTHDEIRREVWGDERHVNFQDSVHYCVRQIRAALADKTAGPGFVETVPRRGYRLRADAMLPVEPRRITSWRRALALACLAAALAVTTAFVERRPNNHHQIAVAVLQSLHDVLF